MLQNPELHYLDNAATTMVAPEVADVIDKAIELGTISADKKEVLNDWLANPWTWAARHALTPMDNEN